MTFLIDMNLSPLWVSFLAGRGIEAIHWSTIGKPKAADSEILNFAARGWAVLTHDLDFGALLAASRTKTPSVVQVRRQDVLPSAIGDIVVGTIRTAEPQLEAGTLLRWTPFATVFVCCRSEGPKHLTIELSEPRLVAANGS